MYICRYKCTLIGHYVHTIGFIWNEHTVIVNRDTDGFGFTSANANPVSVTTGTTENGLAARADIIADLKTKCSMC